MNFAFWLVVLSLVSGVIYLLDILFWAPQRTPTQKPSKLIEYARSFFPVFFIVLLMRSFLVEPFRIPSGSLEPTLLVGDFLAVNKFAYGIRLPVWEKKVISISNPKTGEIAVFRWPPDPSFDYIKRVIGVPGDKIQVKPSRCIEKISMVSSIIFLYALMLQLKILQSMYHQATIS